MIKYPLILRKYVQALDMQLFSLYKPSLVYNHNDIAARRSTNGLFRGYASNIDNAIKTFIFKFDKLAYLTGDYPFYHDVGYSRFDLDLMGFYSLRMVSVMLIYQ